jgi:hypothetical protein
MHLAEVYPCDKKDKAAGMPDGNLFLILSKAET